MQQLFQPAPKSWPLQPQLVSIPRRQVPRDYVLPHNQIKSVSSPFLISSVKILFFFEYPSLLLENLQYSLRGQRGVSECPAGTASPLVSKEISSTTSPGGEDARAGAEHP